MIMRYMNTCLLVIFFCNLSCKFLAHANEAQSLGLIDLVKSARPYVINITIPTTSGRMHRFEDLRENPIFTEDAQYLFNGVYTDLPDVTSYSKSNSKEEIVALFRKKDMKLKSLAINDKYHRVTKRYQSIGDGYYFDEIIETKDEEEEEDNQVANIFTYDRYALRARIVVASATSFFRNIGGGDPDTAPPRSGECTGVRKEFRIALIFDSSLCSALGGEDDALDNILEAFVATNTPFSDDVCGELKISHLEGWCDSAEPGVEIDPYKEIVAIGATGCFGFGILDAVSQYWEDFRPDVIRTAMLFLTDARMTKSGEGSAVEGGCAFMNGLCQQPLDTAIAHFTFNPNSLWSRRNVLVHELGHVFGASHPEESADECLAAPFEWMCATLNNFKEKFWNQDSKNKMIENIVKTFGNEKGCDPNFYKSQSVK